MSYCVLSSNYALAFSHCSKTASCPMFYAPQELNVPTICIVKNEAHSKELARCLTARLADDIPIAGMSLGLAEMNRRAEALGLNKPKRTARKSKDGEEPQDSDLETPSKQPKDESTPTPRSTEKDSKPKNEPGRKKHRKTPTPSTRRTRRRRVANMRKNAKRPPERDKVT